MTTKPTLKYFWVPGRPAKDVAEVVLERFRTVDSGRFCLHGADRFYVVGIESLDVANLFKAFLDAHGLEYKQLTAEQMRGEEDITSSAVKDRVIRRLAWMVRNTIHPPR